MAATPAPFLFFILFRLSSFGVLFATEQFAIELRPSSKLNERNGKNLVDNSGLWFAPSLWHFKKVFHHSESEMYA